MARYAHGTYLAPETDAYPNGGQTRKGRARFPDGTVRTVWAGIPDTYFSIPAHARVRGRYVAGHVTVATASGLSTATDDDPAFLEFRPYDRYAAILAPRPVRPHYHVHSSLGNGYLCECDAHYPLDAAGRDAALRSERDSWRDYAAEVNGDPTLRGISRIRISGSVRSGAFVIDDPLSLAWARYVNSWTCHESECLALLED